MQPPVRSQGLPAGDLKSLALKICDAAAGFFYQKYPGGGIPRIEIELPEAVETPRGHVTQVDA